MVVGNAYGRSFAFNVLFGAYKSFYDGDGSDLIAHYMFKNESGATVFEQEYTFDFLSDKDGGWSNFYNISNMHMRVPGSTNVLISLRIGQTPSFWNYNLIFTD